MKREFKFEHVKEVLKNKKAPGLADECAAWMMENDYIYNQVFGWEKIEIIESFGLNPNMKGVPAELKPKWVEAKDTANKDRYGNTIKLENSVRWVQHPTEKEWYPSDNWLAYCEFKKRRTEKLMAELNVPAPEY